MKTPPLPKLIGAASYIADHPETGVIVSYAGFGAGVALIIGSLLIHNESSRKILIKSLTTGGASI